jgi:hypothetical protein
MSCGVKYYKIRVAVYRLLNLKVLRTKRLEASTSLARVYSTNCIINSQTATPHFRQ